MKMIFAVLLAVMLGAVFFTGCEPGETEKLVEPSVVGVDPLDVKFIEQTSYDIPAWLSGNTQDRILVRFSAFDCLNPVDPNILGELKTMAGSGRYERMVTLGNVMNPNGLYTSANSAYLAHELGVAREIIWVVPGFESVNEEDYVMVRNNLTAVIPQAAEDIQALKLEGGVISGTVMGIPLKVLALSDLRGPGEPVLLSIDASYMYALYKDEKTTRSLPFISGMFKLIGEAGISSDYVSISASNEDRRCPYKLRVLAEYLRKMLEDPTIAAADPPKLWSDRALAWKAEQQDAELSLPIFRDIIKNYPEDAATRYDLAEAYFRLGRLDEAGKALVDTVRLDIGYLGAFSEFAGSLASAGRKKEADAMFAMMPDPIMLKHEQEAKGGKD